MGKRLRIDFSKKILRNYRVSCSPWLPLLYSVTVGDPPTVGDPTVRKRDCRGPQNLVFTKFSLSDFGDNCRRAVFVTQKCKSCLWIRGSLGKLIHWVCVFGVLKSSMYSSNIHQSLSHRNRKNRIQIFHSTENKEIPGGTIKKVVPFVVSPLFWNKQWTRLQTKKSG